MKKRALSATALAALIFSAAVGCGAQVAAALNPAH